MTVYPLCNPYVWENPKILLVTGFTVKQHKEGECASEYVNHIILIFTLCLIIGLVASVFIHSSYTLTMFMGFATLYCIPSFMALINIQKQKEGFSDSDEGQRRSGKECEVYDVIGGAAPAKLTLPSARNPFMNVLIDEIKYNPTRPIAASVLDPSMKVSLDEFFRTEFNNDPTDVFGKTQSQRQFVSMPSTSIPNDVDSYQNWLYRIPGKTCKEGGREACLPGTDGAAIPWLNSTP